MYVRTHRIKYAYMVKYRLPRPAGEILSAHCVCVCVCVGGLTHTHARTDWDSVQSLPDCGRGRWVRGEGQGVLSGLERYILCLYVRASVRNRKRILRACAIRAGGSGIFWGGDLCLYLTSWPILCFNFLINLSIVIEVKKTYAI